MPRRYPSVARKELKPSAGDLPQQNLVLLMMRIFCEIHISGGR